MICIKNVSKINSHSFLFISIIGMFKKEEISVKPPDVNESYKIYEEGLNAMKRNEFFFAAKKFSEAEKILPQIDHSAKALLCQVFVIIQLIFMMTQIYS